MHRELTPGVVANVSPTASPETITALKAMAQKAAAIIPTRDCWRCFSAVEVEPRTFTERCPHCGAYDPHGSPQGA